VQSFSWIFWVFGAVLLVTGARLLLAREEEPHPDRSPMVRLFKRIIPMTGTYHGGAFVVREAGRTLATPLLLALVAAEFTDIVFAVDSIPAVFGLWSNPKDVDPFIVYTSNIFAILGLRNLYFMLRGAIDKFHMLKYGLGIVLIFVGLKMTVLNKLFGGHFPIEWSLGIIVGVIGISVVLSLIFPKPPHPPGEPPMPLPPGHEIVMHDKDEGPKKE
jgi:tellurite resistance protein TerC